jgi:phosphoglycerate dehydrogenase-like enzyme
MSGRARRFRRAVVFGIAPQALGAQDWRRLEAAAHEVRRVGPRADLAGHLGGTDALLVDIGLPVSAAAIGGAPDLRYIGVFGTGYSEVDLRAADRKGVVVTHVPGYATQSVAEFTVAAILNGLRPTRGRPPARGRQLRGRRVGVVGLGRIGTAVAQIAARGFGAQVRTWSRSGKAVAGAAPMGLDALLSDSEVVSLSLALNDATRGMIDRRRIALLPRGCVVVNFASAGLVDQRALLRRATAGEVSVALDHADELDARVRARYRALPNVRVYSPVGFETLEAAAARAQVFLANMEAFLRAEPQNVVNGNPRA